MRNRRTVPQKLHERARRESTEHLNRASSIKLICAIAKLTGVQRDAVASIGWIVAYGMALDGLITDRAMRVWRLRVMYAVWHSPERRCSRCMSLDDLDAGVVGLIDDRTPEAIHAESVSTEIVAPSDKDGVWASEAIYQSKALAARLDVSERHARRILARWRRQDEIRGEDV